MLAPDSWLVALNPFASLRLALFPYRGRAKIVECRDFNQSPTFYLSDTKFSISYFLFAEGSNPLAKLRLALSPCMGRANIVEC